MPSFLTKVFGGGRKKDSPTSASSNSPPSAGAGGASNLLEGKFEAVSPTVSPSAQHFAQFAQRRTSADRPSPHGQTGLANLFRGKGARSPLEPKSPAGAKASPAAPHLSLNLGELREERRALAGVFENDEEAGRELSNEEIAVRNLSAPQTAALVRACAHYIEERGLETLGLMHPHWHSSSPDAQRKLLSLFLNSLHPTSTVTTSTRFDSELEYTRDPHDVASVLRWAVRHFSTHDGQFGGNSQWYTSFAQSERTDGYPEHAFTTNLNLPKEHREVLMAVLDVTTSIAARAEANGISGSKLSKLLGLWLLEDRRAREVLLWTPFYEQWERAGRVLEHLFLARIRDESSKLPARITTLTQGYPYGTYDEADGLLSRPRFSTRRYPALFIQVDSELSDRNGKSRQLPRRAALAVVADALRATVHTDDNTDTLLAIWRKLKEGVPANEGGAPDLTKLFTTETINLLGLTVRSGDVSPTTEALIARPAHARGRSFSVDDAATVKDPSVTLPPAPAVATEQKPQLPASPTNATTDSSWTLADWKDFSTAGFSFNSTGSHLASTLLDSDVERTNPPTSAAGLLRRKSSKRGTSTPPGVARGKTPKLSLDIPRAPATSAPPPATGATPGIGRAVPTVIKSVKRLSVDEAFVDFWADALTDPIVTAQWPPFALCRLRSPVLLPSTDTDVEERTEWLVLERTYSLPPPQPVPAAVPEPGTPVDSAPGSATEDNHVRSRTTSPRPSIEGRRVSSALSATKKRFSLFSRTSSSGGEKATKAKGPKSPKVGELGETLAEEEEASIPAKSSVNGDKGKSDAGIASVAAGVGVAAIAAGVGATIIAESLGADEQPAEDKMAAKEQSAEGPTIKDAKLNAHPADDANLEVPDAEAKEATAPEELPEAPQEPNTDAPVLEDVKTEKSVFEQPKAEISVEEVSKGDELKADIVSTEAPKAVPETSEQIEVARVEPQPESQATEAPTAELKSDLHVVETKVDSPAVDVQPSANLQCTITEQPITPGSMDLPKDDEVPVPSQERETVVVDETPPTNESTAPPDVAVLEQPSTTVQPPSSSPEATLERDSSSATGPTETSTVHADAPASGEKQLAEPLTTAAPGSEAAEANAPAEGDVTAEPRINEQALADNLATEPVVLETSHEAASALTESDAIPKPAIDEAVLEEVVTEQPLTLAPTTEEPTALARLAEEPADVTLDKQSDMETSAIPEPKESEAPIEEPPVLEPATADPITEESVVPDPEAELAPTQPTAEDAVPTEPVSEVDEASPDEVVVEVQPQGPPQDSIATRDSSPAEDAPALEAFPAEEVIAEVSDGASSTQDEHAADQLPAVSEVSFLQDTDKVKTEEISLASNASPFAEDKHSAHDVLPDADDLPSQDAPVVEAKPTSEEIPPAEEAALEGDVTLSQASAAVEADASSEDTAAAEASPLAQEVSLATDGRAEETGGEPVVAVSSMDSPSQETSIERLAEDVPSSGDIIDDVKADKPVLEERVDDSSEIAHFISDGGFDVPESAVEQPAIEQPVHEEPTVENPIIEEPVVEGSGTDKPTDKASNADNAVEPSVVGAHDPEDTAAAEPVAEALPSGSSAVNEPSEEPAIQSVVIETPTVEQPVVAQPADELPLMVDEDAHPSDTVEPASVGEASLAAPVTTEGPGETPGEVDAMTNQPAKDVQVEDLSVAERIGDEVSAVEILPADDTDEAVPSSKSDEEPSVNTADSDVPPDNAPTAPQDCDTLDFTGEPVAGAVAEEEYKFEAKDALEPQEAKMTSDDSVVEHPIVEEPAAEPAAGSWQHEEKQPVGDATSEEPAVGDDAEPPVVSSSLGYIAEDVVDAPPVDVSVPSRQEGTDVATSDTSLHEMASEDIDRPSPSNPKPIAQEDVSVAASVDEPSSAQAEDPAPTTPESIKPEDDAPAASEVANSDEAGTSNVDAAGPIIELLASEEDSPIATLAAISESSAAPSVQVAEAVEEPTVDVSPTAEAVPEPEATPAIPTAEEPAVQLVAEDDPVTKQTDALAADAAPLVEEPAAAEEDSAQPAVDDTGKETVEQHEKDAPSAVPAVAPLEATASEVEPGAHEQLPVSPATLEHVESIETAGGDPEVAAFASSISAPVIKHQSAEPKGKVDDDQETS